MLQTLSCDGTKKISLDLNTDICIAEKADDCSGKQLGRCGGILTRHRN